MTQKRGGGERERERERDRLNSEGKRREKKKRRKERERKKGTRKGGEGVKIGEKRREKTELGGTVAGNSYYSVKSDDRRASKPARFQKIKSPSFWETEFNRKKKHPKRKNPPSPSFLL